MHSSKRAFTLIELLVVIAIIAILAAILFPVFAQAKAAAKRVVDMSNTKEITLGLHMYSGDSDDSAPPMWQVQDWGNSRDAMVFWKDCLLPYIKNGGRYPKPGGGAYTSKGEGGIFQSPLASDYAWSGTDLPAGVVGDASSRFPRSYVVNNSAGENEHMGSTESDGSVHWYTERATFWPKVEPTDGVVKNQGGSGQITSLDRPAETIAFTTYRKPWPNVKPVEIVWECTAQGQGWGGTGMSCTPGTGNGAINYGFMDGHAKNVKVAQAVSNDYYDGFKAIVEQGVGDYGSKLWILNNMPNVKEWK